MKRLLFLLAILGLCIANACKDDNDSVSERFKLLTDPVWNSDSLLANGVESGGAGGLLEKFAGETKFNTDGTGYVGQYDGTWKFAYNETEITITSDSLLFPVTAQIVELTKTSFKITTGFPNPAKPTEPILIRMTFKPK
jgi:hypothetical protein